MRCAPGQCIVSATAPEAAGEIHTDLQKGFIRAEGVAYDDLISLGGMNEAKAKGRLRLEGKEYIVLDGDILNIALMFKTWFYERPEIQTAADKF